MKKMITFLMVSFFVTGAAFAAETAPEEINCEPITTAVDQAKKDAQATAESSLDAFKAIKDGKSAK